jgi:serine phosphatase RsbU (regulator of sigma subunit)
VNAIKKIGSLALLCFFFAEHTKAQLAQLGNFTIHNYNIEDFNSPVQFYSAVEYRDGSILFSNHIEIVNFNGIEWSPVPLDSTNLPSNSTPTENLFSYCLYKTSDNRYFGTREFFFGEFTFTDNGFPIYSPIHAGENLTEMWTMCEEPTGDLLYHSDKELFAYSLITNAYKELSIPKPFTGGEIRTIINSKYGALFTLTFNNDSLINAKYGKDVYLVKKPGSSDFEIIEKPSDLKPGSFKSTFEIDSITYVIVENNGIYPLYKKNNKYHLGMTSNYFESMPKDPIKGVVHDDFIYIATEKNGVLVYNKDGNIVTRYSDKNGLQDNNIYDFIFDSAGDLWLCLDNGISVIELSSPSSYWTQSHGVIGGIESIEVLNDDILLLSRTKGILNSYAHNNKMYFAPKTDMEEAAYDLELAQTDDGLKKLVVGYSGIFQITDDLSAANKVIDEIYAWRLYDSGNEKNKVYVGGEEFFGKMTFENGKWSFEEKAEFGQNIRSMVQFNDYVYFGVEKEGVFKWKEGQEPVLVESIEQNPSFTYFLVIFNNKLYVGTDNGLLILSNNKLERAEIKDDVLSIENVSFHRLYSNKLGDKLWSFSFLETDKIQRPILGYFAFDEFGNLNWNEVKDPILSKGIVNDIKESNGVILFGSNKGLIAFDYEKYKFTQKPWEININEIIINDTLSYGNFTFGNFSVHFDYGQNVRFKFSPKTFTKSDEIEYRTRIIGYSNDWSSYEKIAFKDFEKLPHGTFTIEVQAKNAYGKESEIVRMQFVVAPPWYFTKYAFTGYGLMALIIILLSAKLSAYRVQQKNKLLEQLITERTEEIAEQNVLLEQQKSEIESKNEDILDSIKYAKRIQDTILPTDEKLNELVGEHFVFFQPKDIVSGDFYWLRKTGDTVLLTAIDCTGHGVPGALVSFVGNNALLRVVNEFQLKQPAQVLDKLRELVIKSFQHQSNLKVRDGMDMALVAIHKNNNKLEYAGANNSLYLIRDGELTEIKADKQPIGYFDKATPFSNHEVTIQKGDCIYLFSDGFVDQFGGADETSRALGGKKYKSKNFKDLLLLIYQEPMTKQKEILNEAFFKWKGDLEQVDDVCVIGVRL